MHSFLPWRRIKAGEAPLVYEPSEFARALVDMAKAQEALTVVEVQEGPTIDEIVARWSAMYDEQTGVLEQTLKALEEQTLIVDQARNLMTVIAQRAAGGHPMFLLNDTGGAGDIEMLRHAIVTLTAALSGTELPPMVAIDRVLH